MVNTVTRLSEPYENFLLRPPSAGPGVCATCWRDVASGTHCDRCREHVAAAPHLLADVVVPIALAVSGKQFADELGQYKNSRRHDVRRRLGLGLAAVAERFTATHETCLAGAGRFDIVTTVPSARGRAPHPLATIVGRTMSTTRERYRALLEPGSRTAAGRTFAVDRFTCSEPLSGRRVLLVDDTWTTGASAQSAAAALRLAGASTVATLVLGRRFDVEFQPELSARYLARAGARRFDWETCCLCQEPSGWPNA
ncbi:hypothetical protein [Umezawaea sp.]|uniref:hypothetical protein n=1 Tax=Umezawaea sp. TaxID=1955258 RepID=UPI002ED1FC0D